MKRSSTPALTGFSSLFLATVLFVAAGCQAGATPEPPVDTAVPVRVAEVRREVRAEPVRAVGVLAARDEVRLSFKVPGIVSRLLVDEGDRVRQGQALATLDPLEIAAQVNQAAQGAEKAERDLARVEALYRDSVVTLEQLQDARTGFEVAQSALQIARFNERHAAITAPVDGVVLKRQVEEGELVGPGAPVYVVGSTRRGWVVRAGLADRDALRVAPGDRATLSFDALPGPAIAGRVTDVSVAAAARTGTYEVEVAVDAGDVPLASGLVADVEIVPARAGEVVLVPVAALVEGDGDAATVFTVGRDGATAVRVPVTVAFFAGDHVALRTGLDSVRSVVTSGVAYLRDGTAVRVVGGRED